MKKEIFSVEKIASKLKSYKNKADSLLILGSGWNRVVEKMKVERQWDFEDVFGVSSGVKGHKGELILGKIGNKLIWIMAGRLHRYEGYESEKVTRPIQAFSNLGVKNLILTSAAGGLNTAYKVSDIVVLSDLITIFCESPLKGDKFQDLSSPFDKSLRKKANLVCKKEKISSQSKGVYIYLHGPHYETFSDKKALRILGADCVGMSMVPEAIMANYLRLNVLGLSCITNLAFVEHSHKEVLTESKKKNKDMSKLLLGVLGRLC